MFVPTMDETHASGDFITKEERKGASGQPASYAVRELVAGWHAGDWTVCRRVLTVCRFAPFLTFPYPSNSHSGLVPTSTPPSTASTCPVTQPDSPDAR